MLGDLLKSRRQKLGVSLDTAASAIGCTKGHLHDMERGRSNNPCLELMVSFMAYYKISWAELLLAWEPTEVKGGEE